MDWVGRAAGLRRWSRQGERAPHKPLLMLLALGRFQQGERAGLRYTEIEQALAELLAEYGPARRTSPAYPFHHLASDGVWEVTTDSGAGSPGTSVTALRETGATGRFTTDLREALSSDPALLPRLGRVLLDANFPPSLHAEICESVGLELEAAEVAAEPSTAELRRRDPAMRERVLIAYEYRCAFCGFDGALGRVPVGLEAAHVRWWAFGGPDTVTNALCLCSLHHKLFDRGVLGLDADLRIIVSERFVGRSDTARRHVLDLAGGELLGPQTQRAAVAHEHVRWHRAQVFHGEPRPARST
jgi:putative restriction endonuclease